MARAGAGGEIGGSRRAWRLPTAGLLALLTLAACSPSPTMNGEVRDNFGVPLAGVAVSIDNSSYVATTDEKGRYSIPFDPGAVNIRFAKDGYAAGHFGIRLPQRKPQKIEAVALQKFPPGPGLWLVAGGAYTAAARCELSQQSLNVGRRPTTVTFAGEPITVNAGVAPPHVLTFVDTHAWSGGLLIVPLLFKAIEDNEIFRFETSGVNATTRVEQVRIEETGKPDASVGKWFAVRVADGTYVYAARALITGAGFGPDAKNACYVFKVGGPK